MPMVAQMVNNIAKVAFKAKKSLAYSHDDSESETEEDKAIN